MMTKNRSVIKSESKLHFICCLILITLTLKYNTSGSRLTPHRVSLLERQVENSWADYRETSLWIGQSSTERRQDADVMKAQSKGMAIQEGRPDTNIASRHFSSCHITLHAQLPALEPLRKTHERSSHVAVNKYDGHE